MATNPYFEDLAEIQSGEVTSWYVYLNNAGEDLSSLEFGLNFSFEYGGTLPNFFLGSTNLITGASLEDASLYDIRLEWDPCLPTQPYVNVARIDVLYFGPAFGIVCLGPSAGALPGETAPMYMSCDGSARNCLGPSESFIGVFPAPPGAQPGCIRIGPPYELATEPFPWECDGSVTVVPVGERSWSSLKAGWQR